MNSKTCYTRDHTKKPNERSNAKLSGGAAVRLSAGLERGGAANDEHKKNSAFCTATVFKTLIRLRYPNRLPLNSARELASPDALEKDPLLHVISPKRTDAAGENFRLQSSLAERNNTADKNAAPEAIYAANAG